MRYYISDQHFYHERLNTHMDCRGFPDVSAMNTYMISQWNSRVRKKDEVVILGDFSWANAQLTGDLLRQLKGKKYLILGNHDHFVDMKGFDHSLLEWVGSYREMNDEGRKVVLSHYPIMCYNKQYRKNREGIPTTYMLYGHVHNTYDEILVDQYIRNVENQLRETKHSKGEEEIPIQMINCFCMFSDYVPLTLDEWIETDRKRRMQLREKERGDNYAK
ncbi:MAG: metallophosphoesterase family protein [Anaerolineaceae bacterium]|nr:metallophosphoesterase family protein [Anaerolineaceae bacterium]